jgi:hypothetical protein
MAIPESSIVVGVFTEAGEADRAIDELENAGFRGDQIKLERHEDGTEPVAQPGAIGTVGVLSPGLVDPITTSTDSARQSGLIGRIRRLFEGRTDVSIVDDLVSMGVPEEEARYYQNEFELGRTILTVETGDRQAEALTILRSNGATDITTPRETQNVSAQAGTATAPTEAYDPNAQSSTDNLIAPQGTYSPNTQASTTTAPTSTDDSNTQPNAQTSTTIAPTGIDNANVQPSTYNPPVSQGTYDPNSQPSTNNAPAAQGAYDPNASTGTDETIVLPETTNIQARQTDTSDNGNA